MTKVFGTVEEAELVPSVPKGATTAEGQRLWMLLVPEANGCITDSSYTMLVMWYNQLQCLFYSWSVGALLWLNLAFEELSDTSVDFVGFRQSACEYCYSDVCHTFSFFLFLSVSFSTNMLLIYPVCEKKIWVSNGLNLVIFWKCRKVELFCLQDPRLEIKELVCLGPIKTVYIQYALILFWHTVNIRGSNDHNMTIYTYTLAANIKLKYF